MINANLIQELKTKTDLVQLFSQYGHIPKKKGQDYKVLCPFHEDKEPSLSINTRRSLWQCFGCGEAGDAITFIQKIENIPFVEAVKKLATAQGYAQADLEIKTEKKYSDWFQNVTEHYHQTFLEKPEAREYLAKRGISDEQLFHDYQLGYVDGSLLTVLPKEYILKLIESGILLDNKRERFANCVVFPLYNDTGQVVSFYGRHTSTSSVTGKGSNAAHFYLPGPRKGLFNLKQLKEKNSSLITNHSSLIITESIIDTLSFINKGLVNVLALYGTNGFTAEHEALLKEIQPEQVILALDGDEQGQKVIPRLKEKITAILPNISFFNCLFLDNQDANEYFLSHNKSDFEKLADVIADGNDGQLRRVDHITTATGAGVIFQIKYVELKQGKLNATVKIQQGNRLLLDTYNLYSQKQRETLISEAAKLLAQKPESLEKEVEQLITICELKAQDSVCAIRTNEADAVSSSEPIITAEEKSAAIAYLKQSDLLNQIVKDYETLGYTGEEINKQLAYLVMISRKLRNPLSMIITSNSAAGKSSLQKTTLELCPPEDSKHFTRLTQQSLYYLGEKSLQHKFISIEEEEGSSEASYSLKTLLSAKVLHVASTTTDPKTGRMKADEYRAEGPVAVMVSTTSPDIEPELASRTLLITIDESKEQTNRIHEKQRLARTLESRLHQQKREGVVRLHHNIQRILDSNLAVINNYADQLTFPSDRLKHRRGHDQYLDLIETIAFLRQLLKPVKSADNLADGLKYIEVDKDDIQLANEIFVGALGLSVDELKPVTRELLSQIVEYCRERGERLFTRREIREAYKWESVTLHRHLKALEDLDYICQTSPSYNGQRHQYELLYEGSATTEKFVIGLKDVASL